MDDGLRPRWWPYRGCIDVPTAVFFPDDAAGERAAKAVCATCPVRVACLDYAVEEGIEEGVWGGTGEWTRRRRRRVEKAVRRAMQAPPPGVGPGAKA